MQKRLPMDFILKTQKKLRFALLSKAQIIVGSII